MSIQAMVWVLQDAPDLPPHLSMTLMGLANHADEQGKGAYPSQKVLAGYARKGPRAVRKDLIELLALGLIRAGDARMVAHLPADRRPVVYELAVERTHNRDGDEGNATTGRTSGSGRNPKSSPTDPESSPNGTDVGGNCDSARNQTSKPGGTTVPTNRPMNRPLKPTTILSATNAADPPPHTGSAIDEVRSDVEQVCDHLADRIEANGCKRPTITTKWRTAARLLLDKDGRSMEQIVAAIDWCQNDEFWRSNIMSMPKLRERYDQLRLAAQRTNTPQASPSHDRRSALDRAMQRAAAKEANHPHDQLGELS